MTNEASHARQLTSHFRIGPELENDVSEIADQLYV